MVNLRAILAGWLFFAAPVLTLAGPPPEHLVLQLPFTHQFQFAGYYAAQFRGYYAAEGLDVELRPNLSSEPALTLVTPGRADYGVFQSMGLLSRWARRHDIIVLAAVMQHSPFAIAVRADSDIHGPADLIRGRLAINSSRLAVEVKMMLEREGLDFNRLRLVPNRWGVDELGAGTADAMDVYITNRPVDMKFNRGEEWRLIQPRDYGADYYGDCLFGLRDHVLAHPAQAEALRRASLRGWEYALTHREEVRDWILTRLPDRPANLTPEMLDFEASRITGLIDAGVVEIGHMNPGRWQAMADGIQRFGANLPAFNLDGFLFDPNVSRPLPGWVRGLWWILGVVAAGFLVALYAIRRLRRLVERRARELQASEERMRHFVENSTVGIYRSSPDGRIIFANDALIRMMGYGSLAELTARNLEQEGYEPSYSRQQFKREIETLGVVNGLEAAWRRRDGTVIFVRESANVVRGADGRVEFYDGVVEDISLRKQAEMVLRESEERFRNLTSAAFEGIVISEQGRVLDVNEQAARLIGCDRAELLGRSMLDFIAPESREQAARNIQARRETGYRLVLLRRDGKRFQAECQAKMMRTGDRELRMTAFRDITAQLEAQERERRLEEQLRQKQKMEAVGTLAGGIAHDFNNILTGILGNLELAQLELSAAHPAGPGLEAARKASLRARELVARILAFSRQEDDRRAPAALAPIVQEALHLLQVGLPATVSVRTNFAADCPLVSCDPSQIHQIVMNLGTNSLHAFGQGGGTITVELQPVNPDAAFRELHPQVRADHRVRLSFRDDGCGIEPEVRQRIFEPFFTTKSFGQGTGLGLSTVHAIVTNHQGAVTVESVVGAGTTFSLYFPAAAADPAPAAPATPGGGLPPPFGGGRRILLVDDDDFVRDVNARLLRRLGFEPVPCPNGAEALVEFQAAPAEVSAVISDLAMPGMNGVELARQILGLRPATPVIFSSGHFPSEVQNAARALGIRAFIHKPFEVRDLVQALEDALVRSGRDAA